MRVNTLSVNYKCLRVLNHQKSIKYVSVDVDSISYDPKMSKWEHFNLKLCKFFKQKATHLFSSSLVLNEYYSVNIRVHNY